MVLEVGHRREAGRFGQQALAHDAPLPATVEVDLDDLGSHQLPHSERDAAAGEDVQRAAELVSAVIDYGLARDEEAARADLAELLVVYPVLGDRRLVEREVTVDSNAGQAAVDLSERVDEGVELILALRFGEEPLRFGHVEFGIDLAVEHTIHDSVEAQRIVLRDRSVEIVKIFVHVYKIAVLQRESALIYLIREIFVLSDNLLCDETRGLYSSTESLDNIIWINTTYREWVNEALKYIDPKKRTALLRYKKTDAERGASELSLTGSAFTYIPQIPIADITTETAWLYSDIAKYRILQGYSVYDLISEIPAESVENKSSIVEIKKRLESIAKVESYEDFCKTVIDLCDYLGYQTRPEHLQKLFSTVSDRKYVAAFDTDSYQNIAITFHSSKCLEFDQVIIFAGDYQLLEQSGIYNHYVAVTRAKEKVVIIKLSDQRSDNKFEKDLSNIFAESGLTICNLVTYK